MTEYKTPPRKGRRRRKTAIIPVEKTPEQEGTPAVPSSVSEQESCAMVERKWRGYPVWQCQKCRVDTLEQDIALAASRKCRA